MTAAATTGPKSDPRPTSSTPATSAAPEPHASFSYFRVQRRRFSRRNFAAEGESFLSGSTAIRGDTLKGDSPPDQAVNASGITFLGIRVSAPEIREIDLPRLLIGSHSRSCVLKYFKQLENTYQLQGLHHELGRIDQLQRAPVLLGVRQRSGEQADPARVDGVQFFEV